MKKLQNLQAPDPEQLFQELDESQEEKVSGGIGDRRGKKPGRNGKNGR